MREARGILLRCINRHTETFLKGLLDGEALHVLMDEMTSVNAGGARYMVTQTS